MNRSSLALLFVSHCLNSALLSGASGADKLCAHSLKRFSYESKMDKGHKDDNLSELLDFLDAEQVLDDSHRVPVLESYHKVFLSHSGVQKNFVEQLCEDFERWQYFPFFDKRPDSLPKGKKFPELIFQAARQCQVGVLILSEDFFFNSKWPMLELKAIVKAQEEKSSKFKILPVYLGITRQVCTGNEKLLEWRKKWEEWAQEDGRIDVKKWEKACRVLGPSNGIEYVQVLGEVALRKQIVAAVMNLIRPEHNHTGDEYVGGRQRICKSIIQKVRETTPSQRFPHARGVGLYSNSQVGKSTFCKVLGDEFLAKFEGKVCHLDLNTGSSLEREKKVLQELTGMDPESLIMLGADGIGNLLRRRMGQQRVFLAVDDVSSFEQVKSFSSAGYQQGSIVFLTARNNNILSALRINARDCLEMPKLEEDEARRLFLHHAAVPYLDNFSSEAEQTITTCITMCCFCTCWPHSWPHDTQFEAENLENRKKMFSQDYPNLESLKNHKQFHPLALKVLGKHIRRYGSDPSVWVKKILDEDDNNQMAGKPLKEHVMFMLLRTGCEQRRSESQLLSDLSHAWSCHSGQPTGINVKAKNERQGVEYTQATSESTGFWRASAKKVAHKVLETAGVADKLKQIEELVARTR